MGSSSPLVVSCCPQSLSQGSTIPYPLSSNWPPTVSETVFGPSMLSKCVHWKEAEPSALLWVLNNILSKSIWDLRASIFKQGPSFFCCLEESTLFAVTLQIFYGPWKKWLTDWIFLFGSTLKTLLYKNCHSGDALTQLSSLTIWPMSVSLNRNACPFFQVPTHQVQDVILHLQRNISHSLTGAIVTRWSIWYDRCYSPNLSVAGRQTK